MKKKKIVKIKEARKYKDYLSIALKDEEGRGFMTVNIPNRDATLEEIEAAVKKECSIELGEKVPKFKDKEIEVEYEEEE